MARVPGALVLLGAIAGCSDPLGDTVEWERAVIAWVEAAAGHEHITVRIVGTAGCHGLESLDWQIHSSTDTDVVIELAARARPSDGSRCLRLVPFDDTIEVPRPPSIAGGVTIRVVRPGSHPRDMLRMPLWSGDRRVGGTLLVESTDSLCTIVRTSFEPDYSALRYAVFTHRQHPWRLSDIIVAEGYLSREPWPTCGLAETMIIERLTYDVR